MTERTARCIVYAVASLVGTLLIVYGIRCRELSFWIPLLSGCGLILGSAIWLVAWDSKMVSKEIDYRKEKIRRLTEIAESNDVIAAATIAWFKTQPDTIPNIIPAEISMFLWVAITKHEELLKAYYRDYPKPTSSEDRPPSAS